MFKQLFTLKGLEFLIPGKSSFASVFFLCFISSTSWVFAQEKNLDFNVEEQAWLQQHDSITLITHSNFLPFYFKDADGTQSGILSEIADAIKAQTGLTVITHTGNWLEDIDAVKNGTLDGVWAGSDSLAKTHGFQVTDKPLSNLPLAFFAHKNSLLQMNDLADLADSDLIIIKGYETSEKMLADIPAYRSLVRMDNYAQVIKRLKDDSQAVFIGNIVFNYRIHHKPGLPFKLIYVSDVNYDVYMQFSAEARILRNILNKALAKIGDGRIQAIISQWLNLPQTFSNALLSTDERRWLQTQAKIRLGFARGYEPFVIEDKHGNVTGVIPDLVKRIEALLGIEVELVIETIPILQALRKQGLLQGYLAITEQRIKDNGMLKGGLIGESQQVLYSRTGENLNREQFSRLQGKRIAVVKASQSLDDLKSMQLDNQLFPVGSAKDGFNLILEQKVDYFYGLSTDNYYIIKHNLLGIKPLYIDSQNTHKYFVAVNPDQPILAGLLSTIFDQQLKTEVPELIAKWSHFDSRQIRRDLSAEQQQWIKQLPRLKIAVSRTVPPLEYIDDAGKFSGINADYIAIMSQRLGFKVEAVPSIHQHDAYKRLMNGELDIGFLLNPNIRGSKHLRFSRSIFQSPLVLVTKKKTLLINDLSQFNDRLLAIVKNTPAHSLIKEKFPLQDFILVNNVEEGLQAVIDDKAQGIFASSIFLAYQLQRNKYVDLHIALSTAHLYHMYIAVKKELAPLLPLLESSLASFSEQEKRLIFEKWVSIRETSPIDWQQVMLWSSLLAAVVLLFMASFIYWNHKLKQALDDARRHREIAEQASFSKSTFLANMSHEIRTPLNAVLGFSELLQKAPNQTPEQLESLHIINTAGSHLLALINDILDISKIEAGQQKCINSDFDLHQLLRELQSLFLSRCTGKGLKMQCAHMEEVPRFIHADEGKLRQILINLLGNAIKFTDRGHIECQMHSKPLEDQKIKIVIDIIDQGRGIKKQEKHKVFSSYEQTESGINRSEGTGLGLAISRAYARMMFGDITFTSEVGVGSTFSLSFVVSQAEAIEVDEVHQIVGFEQDVSGLSILIVDDHAHNRLLLQRILEPIGFTILQAENGLQAVDAFHQFFPDLILMDKRMPVMDGVEATQMIKKTEAGAKTPVVFISAHAFVNEQADIIEKGGDGFICKPFRQQELLSCIASLLQLNPVTQLIAQPNAALAPPVSHPEQENGEGRVLIVDDNPVNRTLLHRIMNQAGYQCHEAEDGQQALKDYWQWYPDIMLLDIQMPVMNGYEVLQNLSAADKQRCPIIAVTASHDEAENKKLISLGASAVCEKPYNSEKIKQLVSFHLQNHDAPRSHRVV
ncbi:MAG: transporter substrate-binding domain-containing protein [Pseudomonadales bacterium]|nr:transporter substrate-binding domain-containing protein [Pseudomonadales bacterium]